MAQQFSSTAPLRVGILGAAKIAPAALIEPARSMPEVQVAAVAARDLSRAQAYATTNGIPAAYDSYDALLARPDIDAIYNALPPSRHADLTIAALRAGKHVLCEKPFAMNAAEARAMVDAGTQSGRVLMEAFHYRYHPLFGALLDTVRSGQLGRLESIAATFVVPIPARDGELRFDAGANEASASDLLLIRAPFDSRGIMHCPRESNGGRMSVCTAVCTQVRHVPPQPSCRIRIPINRIENRVVKTAPNPKATGSLSSRNSALSTVSAPNNTTETKPNGVARTTNA